jgi:hypothetical protein
MVCTVNTLTLVKDKDFGIKLESATPAVDHPVGGLDEIYLLNGWAAYATYVCCSWFSEKKKNMDRIHNTSFSS